MGRYVLIVFMALSKVVFAGPIVNISDVQISPPVPSILDIITIETEGSFTHAGVTYDESIFTINNSSLYLDLYFTEGAGAFITQPWFHDEIIGTLSQGNYDLLVQAYWRSSVEADYILHDEYSTSFEVVPEPVTLTFLALGGLLIRA